LGLLEQNRGLKVLHITRRNILRTHLTHKLALACDSWVNINENNTKLKVVRLEYSECLTDFEQTWSWQQEFARFFSDHSVMEIVYENLAADY
jgi:hypothetical protein